MPSPASRTTFYRAREQAGLDQKEAARRAALPRARLDRIEAGECIPALDVLIRLAGAYSTSVDDLVSGPTWRSGRVERSGPPGYIVTGNEHSVGSGDEPASET